MAYISTIAFVSTQYVKTNSVVPIPTTLDDVYITNSILQAQNESVQKVIGSPLYATVCSGSLALTQTNTVMNPDYANLLTTFLKPLTMYYALYMAMDMLESKVMNTSIVVKKDATNSNAITSEQLANIKRICIRTVEYWSDQTIRFITTQNMNHQKFPEWSSFTADPDTIIPMRGPGYGKTGLYFGKKKGAKYYGPNNSYDRGTTGMGWNSERGSADADICCR
jgi:hypothetical protein